MHFVYFSKHKVRRVEDFPICNFGEPDFCKYCRVLFITTTFTIKGSRKKFELPGVRAIEGKIAKTKSRKRFELAGSRFELSAFKPICTFHHSLQVYFSSFFAGL